MSSVPRLSASVQKAPARRVHFEDPVTLRNWLAKSMASWLSKTSKKPSDATMMYRRGRCERSTRTISGCAVITSFRFVSPKALKSWKLLNACKIGRMHFRWKSKQESEIIPKLLQLISWAENSIFIYMYSHTVSCLHKANLRVISLIEI